MATIDLTDYTLAELKGLLFDIDKEIRTRQQQEVGKARERILAIARDAGLPTEQLVAGTVPKPRYRNPLDPAQTWSGRGRQPKWVLDALAGGKTLDELESPTPAGS